MGGVEGGGGDGPVFAWLWAEGGGEDSIPRELKKRDFYYLFPDWRGWRYFFRHLMQGGEGGGIGLGLGRKRNSPVP